MYWREAKAELLSELEFGRDETATKRGAPRRAETRGVEEEKDTFFLFAEKSLTAFLGREECLGGECTLDYFRLVDVI